MKLGRGMFGGHEEIRGGWEADRIIFHCAYVRNSQKQRKIVTKKWSVRCHTERSLHRMPSFSMVTFGKIIY